MFVFTTHYSSLLPVSGGGPVGGMLDWHNGAGPSLPHGWYQCQLDYVCKHLFVSGLPDMAPTDTMSN